MFNAMSPRRKTFPAELHKFVTDILAEEGDLDTLKAYGQTCRYLLPTCQSHIFATLVLLPKLSTQDSVDDSIDSLSQKLENLVSIFTHNPGLAFYVRNVQYMVRTPEDKYQIFHAFLQGLPRVETFVFRSTIPPTGCYKMSVLWTALPSTLRLALSHIFSSPCFSRLHLDYISNFPIRTLLECKNLTHLTLESSDFDDQTILQSNDVLVLRSLIFTEYSSRAVRSLLDVKNASGVPMVDFTRLRQLKSDDKTGDVVVREVLQTCKALESLTCTVWDTFNKPFQDLLNPDVLKTLIAFSSVIIIPPWLNHLVDLDPLYCLPEEFEKWMDHNILEIINITVCFKTVAAVSKSLSSWAALNTLANEHGFPFLRQVSLSIRLPKHPSSQETKDHLEEHQNDIFKPLIDNSKIDFRLMVQVVQPDE